MKLHGFRKKLLSAAVAASVTFPIGMANAKITRTTGGDFYPASSFTYTVSAKSGDDYTIVIDTDQKGTLHINGFTLQNKISGSDGVILFNRGNVNYSISMENGTLYNAEILGGDGIDGIVLNSITETPTEINLGKSKLNGKVDVGGHAFFLQENMGGTVTVGGLGALIGGVNAITAISGGAMAQDALFVVEGTITGKSGTAIDFEHASSTVNTNPGLKLKVKNGFIEGDIIGSSADDSDKIIAEGSAVFDGAISGVESITFDGSDKNNSLEFAGDITPSTNAVTVTGQGNVFFSKATSQALTGTLAFNGDSTVKVKVDRSLSGAALAVSSINLNDHTVKFVPVPSKRDFDDDQSKTAVLVSAGNGFNVDNSGTVTVIDSPFSDNEEVNNGNNNNVEVVVNPKTPDEIKEDVKKSGGSNAGNAAGALAEALKSDNSDDAQKLYERLANSDGEEFNGVVEESNVNNAGATQTANTNLASKSKSQITRRLDNLRSNNLADGNSYGDGMDGQSFWVQAMGSDVKMDQRTNDEGSSFSGYDAEMSGLTMGWDKELGNGVRGGVAFTLANVEIDKHNSNDSSNIRNYQMSFYGSWDLGSWYLDGILNLGQSKHNRSRYIDDFLENAITAEFDSSIYGLQFMAGTDLQWDDVTVQPLVGFNYTMVKTDAYTEEANGVVGKLAQDPDGQKVSENRAGSGC